MDQLEKLATEMVGDGQEPNCFFFSQKGKVFAVVGKSYDHAAVVDTANFLGADVVEDRLTGIVWESNPQRADD